MNRRARALMLLAVAPMLLPVALAAGGCGGSAADDEAERPPVVVLVMDEFPTDDLLGPDGQIDAARFPNFARLASMSTWFPNGHTVYDSTFKAVPAILDARLPRRGTAPDVRSHQPSVYHLMDGLGYDIHKVESASAVCPPRICPGTRTRRPGVLRRLAGGGRPGRFSKWMETIRPSERPGFYFHHALMPHEPWLYLPSGHRNRPFGSDPIPGLNRPEGFGNPELSEHNHLRHLLQVGFMDHELGRLLARLRRTGLLDDAVVVVVADHGYSFDVGAESRRLVSDSSVDEIAPVPFFVKAPNQTEGALDEGLVRNIDIVPTIADLLDTEVRWPHDGRSAFSAETRERDEFVLQTRDFRQTIRVTREEMASRRAANRLRWARKFGTGAQSELLLGDAWATAYRIGPHTELVGRRVDGLRRMPAASASRGVRATVANADLLTQVSDDAELLPTRVAGRLQGGEPGTLRDVAVAVNGRIRAVGRSFRLGGAPAERFSLLVPEDALHEGRNRIEILSVDRGGRRLVPLGGTAPAPA